MTALRVAIWNASGLDNLGDRLLDHVAHRELSARLPGVDLATFTPWPGEYCGRRLIIDRNGLWTGHGAFHAIVALVYLNRWFQVPWHGAQAGGRSV